jgi:hypothetical protein
MRQCRSWCYAAGVARLLACPFCRELYPEGEADKCPECGVGLKPMEELPPSLEALAEEVASGNVVPPEERPLPRTYFGRGRGALLVLGLLGLAFFFAPWVEMTRPEIASYSGFELARGRAGWLWGGAAAWFILVPLVWTRRSVARMRGVRIICCLFAAMTLGEVAVMMALPPRGSRYLSFEFHWGWGIYASGLVSLLALYFAARFGGRIDDLPAAPWKDARGRLRADSSHGETLH